MRLRTPMLIAAAALCLLPISSFAALTSYTQNFETLTMADPAALTNDGWLVYGNVFSPTLTYLYGYGAFPAPNGGTAFCSIDANQGGPLQGIQQLSVYNDYNNTDHANGNRIESNVYREMTVAAGDVGTTWTFQFDAKLGNLAGASTALAFIKTLNPAAGYAITHFVTQNTTAIPATWNTYTLTLPIDAPLVGQIFQIGFASTASHYEGSGVFYDNLVLARQTAGVNPSPRANVLELRPAVPNPVQGSTRLDYSLPASGRVDVSVFDVTGRRVATLVQGSQDAGPHVATWDGRSADGRLAPAGIYRAVLQTDSGRQSRSLVVSH